VEREERGGKGKAKEIKFPPLASPLLSFVDN